MRQVPRFTCLLIAAVAGFALPAGTASAASPAALVLGDEERRAATAKLGVPSPVHPVVGAVDYGSTGAEFGAARSGHVHAGQDVFAAAGTPLVAVADGVVVEAGSDGGRGNYVALFDPRHERTYVYFHMVEPAAVREGERVAAGERLGGVGCTGSCWGNHLHFEVRAGRGAYGQAIDPLPLLQRWGALDRPR